MRGLVFVRSGVRRSQEQGESRMTVLPDARNLGTVVTGAGAALNVGQIFTARP